MKFKYVNYYSKAGLKYNEDRGYGTTTYGWVIDGATGLGEVHVTDSESDAAWLVEVINEELKKRIENYEGSIPKLLEEISQLVKKRFYAYKNTKGLKEEALPSAGICIVRLRQDQLEYYTLGDCTLLIQTKEGKVMRIYDDRLCQLDQIAILEMMKITKEKKIDILDAREYINDTLIKNRKMKNNKDGYYCFSIENNQFNKGFWGTFPFSQIEAVAMMSDGYTQYYDTLHCVEDEKEMMKALRIKTLETIAKEIKMVQNKDDRANQYPRFKVSDDMTIVYMTNKTK